MKRFSKKKRTILVVIAVCIGLSAVLAGYLYETRYSKDAVAVKETLLAVCTERNDPAQFPSPTFDLWDTRTFLYKPKGVVFHKWKNEAVLSAYIITWTKGVERNEITGKYQTVQNPAGMDFITAQLVKVDGSWRVLKDLEYRPLSVWGCDDVVKNAVLQSIKVRLNKKPEAAHCLEEIQKNEEIMSKQFDTYEEARAAAEGMDMDHGNYYALAQTCGVHLSGICNAP